MLCSACSRALLGFEHGDRRVHHETFAEVKRAADASCKPCFSFWDSFSEHEQIDLLESDRSPPQDAPDHSKSAVYHLVFGPDEYHQHDTEISMDLYWDEDEQAFDPTGQELYCAGARIQQGYETEEQDDLKCLFLRLVDAETATYARCALASPRDKEDFQVLQAALAGAEDLPCRAREGNEYVIHLI